MNVGWSQWYMESMPPCGNWIVSWVIQEHDDNCPCRSCLFGTCIGIACRPKEDEPILLTCFISLQDIDTTLGPTIWMPGTHNVDAHHPKLFWVPRPLPKASWAIFDPRVLQCASANNHREDPTRTRSLFYMSFKPPHIDHPGCPSTSEYGIVTTELTMEQLVTDLINEQKGKSSTLRFIDCIESVSSEEPMKAVGFNVGI